METTKATRSASANMEREILLTSKGVYEEQMAVIKERLTYINSLLGGTTAPEHITTPTTEVHGVPDHSTVALRSVRTAKKERKRRTLRPESAARIAEAQRKRWATKKANDAAAAAIAKAPGNDTEVQEPTPEHVEVVAQPEQQEGVLTEV